MDKRFEIAGPAGVLECRWTANDKIEGTAVLCHPHPQYGGSMEDMVLDTATHALLSRGIGCLRFNFRGVGASAGEYDGGRGETEDALAALTWLSGEYPDQATTLLGYSFGSAVAWRAAQSAPLRHLVLVAPPIGRMEYAGHVQVPTTVIGGSDDDFIDWNAANAFVSSLPAGSRCIRLAGADHFFGGAWQDLERAIREATPS